MTQGFPHPLYQSGYEAGRKEAADEIERLREALREIQKKAEQQSTMPFDSHPDYFRMARAALGEGKE